MVKKQAAMPSVRAAPKQRPAAKVFTMRHLWRMTLWAATAACALLVAVLAGQSDAGTERIASVFSPGHRHARLSAAQPPFDAQAETRRLAAAVHDLGAENARLRTRLAAVEQNMDDITGSVEKQIAAVKTAAAGSWPADAKPEPITAADIASIMAPAAGLDTPVPSPPQTSPALPPPSGPQASEPQASTDLPPIAPPPKKPHEYGVDMGNALSIQTLHARWLGIRSAHPQLFAGLIPAVTLREIPKTKRIELHLVVGPLENSEAAARLCVELAPYRLTCHPTMLAPDRVALQ